MIEQHSTPLGPSSELIARAAAGQLDQESRELFDALLEADPNLRSEYQEIQAALEEMEPTVRPLAPSWSVWAKRIGWAFAGAAAVLIVLVVGRESSLPDLIGVRPRGKNANAEALRVVGVSLWAGPNALQKRHGYEKCVWTRRDADVQRLLLLSSTSPTQVTVMRINAADGVQKVASEWFSLTSTDPTPVPIPTPAAVLDAEWFVSVFVLREEDAEVDRDRLDQVEKLVEDTLDKRLGDMVRATTSKQRRQLAKEFEEQWADATGLSIRVGIGFWRVE